MSAFDPKRTLAGQDCCCANWPLSPISPVANPCCNRVLFGVVPAFGEGNATTRFHQSDCWFSGHLAAGGACAAGRTHAAHRRADEYRSGRSRSAGIGRSILSRIGRIGLDHRPQCADRLSMVSRQRRSRSRLRGGIARADAGYHPRLWHPRGDSVQATHAHGADRVCAGGRSGRFWHR